MSLRHAVALKSDNRRDKVGYFGAGPAKIPTVVMADAVQDLVNFDRLGIGIGELSHRGPQARQVLFETKALVREILQVPDSHEILFLQGGGSLMFSIVAYLFAKGEYLITGSWSKKAAEEAEQLGVEVVRREAFTAENDCEYTYYCDNETVDGVEFETAPTADNLISDMSSNLFSRAVDVGKHALIFAGAQKNFGLAGITLVIARKSIITRKPRMPCPKTLTLSVIAANNSLYNTLPFFNLDVVRLTLKYLKEKTLAVQEEEAAVKSKLVYDAFNHSLFTLRDDHRSRMNVVCKMRDDLQENFLKEAAAKGMMGLEGHRSVGGIRVSLYNATTVDEVKELVSLINQFKASNWM